MVDFTGSLACLYALIPCTLSMSVHFGQRCCCWKQHGPFVLHQPGTLWRTCVRTASTFKLFLHVVHFLHICSCRAGADSSHDSV